jgi:hypothetical protein
MFWLLRLAGFATACPILFPAPEWATSVSDALCAKY